MNTPKLASVALAALLSGCAVFEAPPGSQNYTTWIKVTDPLPYRWEVTSAEEVASRCAFSYAHPRNACAIRLRNGPNGPYCLILSAMTEAEARNVWLYSPTGAVRSLDGKPETLADHEKKHCAGYNHEVVSK